MKWICESTNRYTGTISDFKPDSAGSHKDTERWRPTASVPRLPSSHQLCLAEGDSGGRYAEHPRKPPRGRVGRWSIWGLTQDKLAHVNHLTFWPGSWVPSGPPLTRRITIIYHRLLVVRSRLTMFTEGINRERSSHLFILLYKQRSHLWSV